LGVRSTREPRQPIDEDYALRFVAEHTGREGQRRPWVDLMKEWNRVRRADWRYDNPKRLARDYWRAVDALVAPALIH